ncbi:DUF5681 domain-containing protein [Bradyrhizobium sp. 186]|uniref:DUF5681 domain-containing protein n=1 Tax=Bradyrhizobium sp. 186 TaxID=2782654 RepID=UPI002000A423|nr:DUF5681 domain-containing protein [Bradyrhizobium sp. 186]UPK38946.1 DUF5681 domain-containing protein [Bradyrhizobium sp. 186]
MAKTSTERGRVLPPEDHRFLKGKSGNPRGRPKGAVSLKQLTRKFAHKKVSTPIDGNLQNADRLQITILMARAIAAQGKPTAARLLAELRAQIAQPEPDRGGGFVVVPEDLTTEEWMAQGEARNAHRVEPGTAINIEAEEFQKAARGEPTEYGQALLAFHRKYRG